MPGFNPAIINGRFILQRTEIGREKSNRQGLAGGWRRRRIVTAGELVGQRSRAGTHLDITARHDCLQTTDHARSNLRPDDPEDSPNAGQVVLAAFKDCLLYTSPS